MNYLAQVAHDVTQSPKAAAVVITATTGSHAATWADLIPANIGIAGSLFGALLSVILMVTHIIKSVRDGKRHSLKMELLQQSISSRKNKNERSTDIT